MDSQGCSEVRRVHIVYFLSRKGRIEHPHLVRVHHLSRNGVRLRDVKRWLGELRGKDMPESFSWSYKRKYKTGYVWQDLLDDDLINPISDNEYVLKGSEISNSTIKDYSYTDEKVTKQNDQFLQENTKTTTKEENQSHNSSETSIYISTKSSSEIEQESPNFGSESSTLTDDSMKPDPTDKTSSAKTNKQEKQDHDHQNTPTDDRTERSSHFYSALLSKKNKKRANRVTIDGKISSSSATADADDDDDHDSKISSSEPKLSKSKSTNTNATSNVFRNLITCGTSDTNDSAVVPISKQSSKPSFLNACSSDLRNVVRQSAEICRRDGLGGSERIFGTPSWSQKQYYWTYGRKSVDGIKDSLKNKSDSREQRASCAAYMPVTVPNCSQCGKPFQPFKMHSHMKSCKGVKALSKGASANAAPISAAVETASK